MTLTLRTRLTVFYTIVFGVLLAATIGTFLFARQKLKVGAPTPTMAIDEAKKIRETVSASTNGGSAVAKAAEAVKAEAEASS